jgi:Ca2+-binding RTX toxin-like protein
VRRRLSAFVIAALMLLATAPASGTSTNRLCPMHRDQGGQPVTLSGTGDPDVLEGRSDRLDVIAGLAGADIITIGEGSVPPLWEDGNDVACGGGGDDNMFGNNDGMYGERGDDWLEGDGGLFGGVGDDTVLPKGGWTVALGGPGNDTIRIPTGSRQDPKSKSWLYGEQGNDLLDSRDGVVPGKRGDKIDGGHGVDVCRIDANDHARRCETLIIRRHKEQ